MLLDDNFLRDTPKYKTHFPFQCSSFAVPSKCNKYCMVCLHKTNKNITNANNNSDMICAVLMFPLFWIESDVNSRTINSILWQTLWRAELLAVNKHHWPWYRMINCSLKCNGYTEITETLKTSLHDESFIYEIEFVNTERECRLLNDNNPWQICLKWAHFMACTTFHWMNNLSI